MFATLSNSPTQFLVEIDPVIGNIIRNISSPTGCQGISNCSEGVVGGSAIDLNAGKYYVADVVKVLLQEFPRRERTTYHLLTIDLKTGETNRSSNLVDWIPLCLV